MPSEQKSLLYSFSATRFPFDSRKKPDLFLGYNPRLTVQGIHTPLFHCPSQYFKVRKHLFEEKHKHLRPLTLPF